MRIDDMLRFFPRLRGRRRNRYLPHQSRRERARRLRQIAEGKLTGTRGFIPYATVLAAQKAA
jgi:hypothetical protein